jgi:transposase
MPKMWVNRDLNACINIAYALMRGVGWWSSLNQHVKR